MGEYEFWKVLSTKRIGTENKCEIEQAAFEWIKEECDKIQQNFQQKLDELKNQFESQIQELSKSNKVLEQSLITIFNDDENEVTKTVRNIIANEICSVNIEIERDCGQIYAHISY